MQEVSREKRKYGLEEPLTLRGSASTGRSRSGTSGSGTTTREGEFRQIGGVHRDVAQEGQISG
eukprot:9204718-Pyramimonas_sp.AAC.1